MSRTIARREWLGIAGSGAGLAFTDAVRTFALPPEQLQKAPFPYVWGTAYHILPESHNNESGYFSLCEGLNRKIYVGTAKYGVNAYLVEFDPKIEKQRIVLDVHKVCGVKDKGYEALAKIHTPNFVGPSGTIYVGSKQGYAEKGDTQEYPGGYVMTYDPKTDRAECLGMPRKGYGVGDVVADEKRNILYVVSERVRPNDPMHWISYDVKRKQYETLGPNPTHYATTLLDKRGWANTLTDDGLQLAQYDPTTKRVTKRPIMLDGKVYKPKEKRPIPTWKIAADGRTAYMTLMRDTTLVEIDLLSKGEVVQAKSHGKMLEGRNPDSRCAVDIAKDGRVYSVIRIDNTTNFGKRYLHHLTRFDPKTQRMEDLGVLAVRNPNFFQFVRPDGSKAPFSHGYHTLPDKTLTPLYHHLAMIVARDGTIYVTILYPFTLLKVDGFRPPKS